MQRELLLLGGRIYPATGDEPCAAILLRAGRVAAVGGVDEVRAMAGPDVLERDLGGATVTPGITDAHVHLTAWALARRRVQLAGSRSPHEVAARVGDARAAGGAGWIVGQGWNQHLWNERPTRQLLDDVVSDRPVLLESQDLHGAWLNTHALERCGITRHTNDPPGGQIVRDADGEPTGVLLEDARLLAFRHLPIPTLPEILGALADAQAEAHSLGITGVHSVEPTGLRDFEALRERGELRLRVLQHVQLDQLEASARVGLRSGFGGDWIRIGGVKMFLDGALGSRTALLHEPYEGTRDQFGISTLPEATFREAVQLAAASGLASTVHAIGDAAVDLAIRVLSEVPPPPALPHRIEHVQLCREESWGRLAAARIVASMQPTHLLTDIPAAEQHWGHARSSGAYAFRALHRAGAVLAFGSDVPVETLDPRPGLFAAVRRVTWADFRGEAREEPWYSEHALSRVQALEAYTEGAARAAGAAHREGALRPGCFADLVAWDQDPLRCEPEELRSLQALMTVVGGEVVHGDGDG